MKLVLYSENEKVHVFVTFRSFNSGISSKDKRQGMMSSSFGSGQDSFGMPSARTVPADLDTSADTGTGYALPKCCICFLLSIQIAILNRGIC